MAMAESAPDMTKMVPGFEFLQDLVKNAGSALPGFGQWVAPTLDPDEIGRRVDELRTVQFWLEQNGRMIATTIQALEVQRMTLSTLKSMNVQAGDLAEAFKIRMPQAPAPSPAPSPAADGDARAARGRKAIGAPTPEAPADPAASPAAGAAPGVVDPMQWWGALTQQFTQIAARAVQDGTAGTAAQMAGEMVRQSTDAMGQALERARMPAAGAPSDAAAPAKAARRRAPRPAAGRAAR
jgi:hypothetical protein